MIGLSVPGWESLFSDGAGIEVAALWGAVVTVFVAPFTSVAAWLKRRRWAAVIGWLGWVLAMFVLFFPIRLLEDEPTGVWLVENFRSVKTVASLTAVVFWRFRCWEPSGWRNHRRGGPSVDIGRRNTKSPWNVTVGPRSKLVRASTERMPKEPSYVLL